jgi:general secretion pathway protein G
MARTPNRFRRNSGAGDSRTARGFATGKLLNRIHCGIPGADGFTLIELMIVISIMLILMAIALPMYNQSVLRAREAVLRQDLFTLRQVIDQYTLDKQKAPQALDDILQAGYLKRIPADPMTGQSNWEVVQEDVLQTAEQQEPGISDVHSASSATASDGTAYSSW